MLAPRKADDLNYGQRSAPIAISQYTLCLKLLGEWLILLYFNGKNVDNHEL